MALDPERADRDGAATVVGDGEGHDQEARPPCVSQEPGADQLAERPVPQRSSKRLDGSGGTASNHAAQSIERASSRRVARTSTTYPVRDPQRPDDVEWRTHPAMDQKLELLKRTPLLADLSKRDIEEVGRLADEVDVRAGRVLLKEGDPGREFFVIIDGQIEITKEGRHLRTMGAGEFLGDIALVVERPRTATATAVTDSRLLVVGHREFHSLMEQFPSIRVSVLESIALRLRDLTPDDPH
jgi:hypothetical protein